MKNKLMACAAFWLPTLALTGCGSQFGGKSRNEYIDGYGNSLCCSDIHCISHIKI